MPALLNSHPAWPQASAVIRNTSASSAGIRSSGRTSTTTQPPSARRAKKSGACRRGPPSPSCQCSQNGWEAIPVTAGIEVHQHDVITFQPGLEPHMAPTWSTTTTTRGNARPPSPSETTARVRPPRTAQQCTPSAVPGAEPRPPAQTPGKTAGQHRTQGQAQRDPIVRPPSRIKIPGQTIVRHGAQWADLSETGPT